MSDTQNEKFRKSDHELSDAVAGTLLTCWNSGLHGQSRRDLETLVRAFFTALPDRVVYAIGGELQIDAIDSPALRKTLSYKFTRALAQIAELPADAVTPTAAEQRTAGEESGPYVLH